MASGRYRFERFTLDPAERRLWMDTTPVELNARYLDALLLLLSEADERCPGASSAVLAAGS